MRMIHGFSGSSVLSNVFVFFFYFAGLWSFRDLNLCVNKNLSKINFDSFKIRLVLLTMKRFI